MNSNDRLGSEPELCPTPLGFLIFLFLKPKRFFEHFRELPSGLAPFVLTASLGLATALSWAGPREGYGLPFGHAGTWAKFWLEALPYGILFALFIRLAAAWWFAGRVPDKRQARTIFLWSAQVAALPTIVHALAGTFRYPSPSVWAAADRRTFGFLLMALSVWAVAVAATGARAVSDVRQGRAVRSSAVAFPLFIVLLFGVGGVLLSDFSLDKWLDGMSVPDGPSPETPYPAVPDPAPQDSLRAADLAKQGSFKTPDLAEPGSFSVSGPASFPRAGKVPAAMPELVRPNVFASRTVSFSYPGNWTILKEDVPFEPDSSVWVQAPSGSVQGILLYGSDLGEEAALNFGTVSLSRIYARSTAVFSFDKWGSFTGVGRSFQGKVEGAVPVTVRVFAASVPGNRVLEIREILFNRALQDDGPGHELVRTSLVLLGSDQVKSLK